MDILEGCFHMLASSILLKEVDIDIQQNLPPCAFYVDEKLKLLDDPTGIYTEKRIADILLEAKTAAT